MTGRLPLSPSPGPLEGFAARFDEAIGAGHGEEDVAAVYEAAKPKR